MRTYTGIVKGQEIKKNLDGDQNVRILQVEITEPDDVQTIQQFTWPGDDNAPVDGDTVVILEISPAYKVVIGIQDQIDPEVDSGERKLYSQALGAIKAFIFLKKDGNMELNGTGDFAVRFNQLKIGFDKLKTDFNLFLLHVHGAAGTPPVPPAIPSTASVDSAKINDIEVTP